MQDAIGKVILTAADLIEQRGHCQHGFTKGEAICMYAGLAIASGNDAHPSYDIPRDMVPVIERVALHIPTAFGDAMGTVCRFNNTHSAEKVIAKLREIANLPQYALPET